jgi:hypothetical protein
MVKFFEIRFARLVKYLTMDEEESTHADDVILLYLEATLIT